MAFPSAPTQGTRPPPQPEVLRLWHSFLTARAAVAFALLVLQGLAQWVGPESPGVWRLALCGAYLMATLAQRVTTRDRPPDTDALWTWTPVLGVDLAVIAALQWLHQGQWSFSPLFGLPILMVSVLGSLRLALGTTAAATLLMLGWSVWLVWHGDPNGTQRLLEAGLRSTAYFIAAYVVHQLAQRLHRAQRDAERQQAHARMQAQVSALLLQPWDEGVLAIDAQGQLCLANPAALRLLNLPPCQALPLPLDQQAAWRPLQQLAWRALQEAETATADLALPDSEGRQLRLRGRAWPITDPRQSAGVEALCVVFLQDQHALDARVRTEKLAAMGRMSAAMAHEIRNPLAAIVQAADLLSEDLQEPGPQRLVAMVQHNANRLARIAEDILDIARVHQSAGRDSAPRLALDPSAAACCADWQAHHPAGKALQMAWGAAGQVVAFDAEHLQRVLGNLLDNGARHASPVPQPLLVATDLGPDGQARLTVWSEGAPLDSSVERHLFEPFFSSSSRSSGLGLYLCRELCQRHGAHIAYARQVRQGPQGLREGNAFTVTFAGHTAPTDGYPTRFEPPPA